MKHHALLVAAALAFLFAGWQAAQAGSCRTQCRQAYNGDGYNCTTYCDDD
jgi:hypothetical protein